jgi:hypothetical protein
VWVELGTLMRIGCMARGVGSMSQEHRMVG